MLRKSLMALAAFCLLSSTAEAGGMKKVALLMAKAQEGASDILGATTNAFVESKRFEVIERDQLPKIFQERDLTDFIKSAAGDLSTLEGVDIIGVVTFGSSQGGDADEPVTHIFLDVRLTDVKTGKVLASVSSRSDSLLVAPTSIHNASQLLLENIRKQFPPEGSILNVEGKAVVVSLGKLDGVKVNDILDVLQEGQVFFNGEGKAFPPMEEIVATLKVVQVDDQLSKAKVKTMVKKGESIPAGARVRLRRAGTSAWDIVHRTLDTIIPKGN